MLLGEVAPAAPALGALVEIAVLLFAFAFVWSIRKLLEALFGWLISILSHVPGLGGYLEGALRSVEQAVANALGAAEHAIDHAIGASWHLLARYMEWVWREIRGNAVLLLEMSTGLFGLTLAIRAAKTLLHQLERAWHGIEHGIKVLEREWHGIEHRVKALEQTWTKGIGHDVRGRLAAAEKEVAHLEHDVIPAIRSAEGQSEAAINNLYEWAKGKAALLGIGTFATAVAAALSVLGLDWLRCKGVGKAGRALCGLGTFLEDLLAVEFLALAPVDLCSILDAAIFLADEASPVFELVTGAFDDLLACQGADMPPVMHVPYYAPATGTNYAQAA